MSVVRIHSALSRIYVRLFLRLAPAHWNKLNGRIQRLCDYERFAMNDRLHFALFDLHAKSSPVASTSPLMQYHASIPIVLSYIEAIASYLTQALPVFHVLIVLNTIFYYRAMHFSAKHGLASTCRMSVCPSVRPSVTLVDQDQVGNLRN